MSAPDLIPCSCSCSCSYSQLLAVIIALVLVGGGAQMLEIIPQALKVQVSHFLEIVVLRFRRLLKSKPSEDIFHLHADSFEVCDAERASCIWCS